MSVGISAKLRILVVDDESSVANTVKMLLQFDGHEAETSNSGRDALAMFESRRFDLVITDYAMPEMNGNQLADAIKADAPDQPVIMITGHSGTFLPSSSVDSIIGKPFQLQHLREAIAKVMLEASTPA
jgi:CheY-like chemotaxis protein